MQAFVTVSCRTHNALSFAPWIVCSTKIQEDLSYLEPLDEDTAKSYARIQPALEMGCFELYKFSPMGLFETNPYLETVY